MANIKRANASGITKTGTAIPDVVDAPTIGTATAGNQSATVAFTAATNGGTATSFTAISTPGSITGSSATSPITVSGLTAGTAYTFQVYGTNASGTWSGVQSAASNSVTPYSPFYSSRIYDTEATGFGTATTNFTITPNKQTIGPNGVVVTVGNRYQSVGTGMGVKKGYISLRDIKGAVLWTAYLEATINLYDAAFDSDGNIYAVGEILSYGGGIILKYNSSGTLQWQRKFDVTATISSDAPRFAAVTVDSSNNIYAVGNFASNTASNKVHGYLVKYDTSGNITWQRKIVTTYDGSNVNGAGLFVTGVVTDSSGNVYISGFDRTQPQTNQSYVASFLIKYNSSGTMQFDNMYSINASGGAGPALYQYDTRYLTKDSSDNLYLYGYYNKLQSDTTSRKYAAILRINSSGTYQAGYEFNFTGNTAYTTYIDSCFAVSSTAMWFTGVFATSNANQSIVLFNHSAGTVTRTRGSDMGNAKIIADSANSRILLNVQKQFSSASFDFENGWTGTNISGDLGFSIIDDGTKTGSYSNVTYNNTATTPTVTNAIAGLWSNQHTLSAGNGTGSTPTYTSTLNPSTITSALSAIS